jgi:hypothetical protein
MRDLFWRLFLFILYGFSHIKAVDKYWQVMEEFSVNFRNQKDLEKFYNYFERTGDLVVYDQFIKMTPKKDNAFGMFKTKGEILTDEFQVQVKFKLNFDTNKGSAMGIFIISDAKEKIKNENSDDTTEKTKETEKEEVEESKMSKEEAGLGIIVMTNQSRNQDIKTQIIFTETNSLNSLLPNLHKIESTKENSCRERMQKKYVKVSINIKADKLSIYHDAGENLHNPCIVEETIKNLKPPYKIAVASLNGEELVNNQKFLDSIEIQKFAILNSKQEVYTKYANINPMNSTYITYDAIKSSNNKEDIIGIYENYLDILDDGEEDSELMIKKALDTSLIHLSDVDKFVDSSTFMKQMNTNNEVMKTYKKILNNFQDKIINLNQQLNELSSSGIKIDYEELFKDFKFEYIAQEIISLKQEWETKTLQKILAEHMNSLINEKINSFSESLNTEDKYMRELLVKNLKDALGEVESIPDYNYTWITILIVLVILVSF